MNYLPYVYSSNEWSSKLKPDYITCSNNICEEKLISQEYGEAAPTIMSDNAKKLQDDAPPCLNCGWIMIRCGTCYRCDNCGTTSGCG